MWKNVSGYEGLYLVNKSGVVKSKRKILKQSDERGYLRVTFSANNKQQHFQVHRLVALMFIPNPENKPCVNHIDGNKHNNNVSNLEWCTYSENEKHSYRILKKKVNKPNQKPVIQVTESGDVLKTFHSISEAARFLKIPHQCICSVLVGKNKKAGGYIWRYA